MQKMHKLIPTIMYVMLCISAAVFSSCTKESPETAENQTALCSSHQLPVDECFICDPALRDPDRLWCQEHDRYEDRCFICHPEIKDANRLWCNEHNLYEDECFFCHPELRKKQKTDVELTESKQSGEPISVAESALFCNEHNLLEEECGICHPELADVLQTGEGLKIRFESRESAKKANVGFTTPLPGKSLAALTFLCRVNYNENRYARITPLAPGVVQRVMVDVGDIVKKGTALIEINSPEISKAKSEYLIAFANEKLKKTVYNRKKELFKNKISSARDYEETYTDYELAKLITATNYQKLINYGIPSEEIDQFVVTSSTSSTLRIHAPFSGTLINRDVVIGETVEPGDITFKLTDLSSMWLELSIPEDRIAMLNIGDLVETTFDVLPELSVGGQITWLASGIDEDTRMYEARAVIPNPKNIIRQGMFGQARIMS
ncbi:MAG: efflux RND transporter periplasmic adaptor subunit, partial [bacterium]|nr:efflux RND transporter periplasmic adaptor subunit [bacterium]